MLTQIQAVELLAFFEKYAAALHNMAQDEAEKLDALMSHSLPRIEQAITTAQANTKQIENLESKRVALQESLGCGGFTFSQLSEQIPEPHKIAIDALFAQIQASVDKIKFTNSKSMTVAHANMTRLNPDAPILKNYAEGTSAAKPYESSRAYSDASSASIFKTTI